METTNYLKEKTKTFNWRMTLKVATIGFLTLILLIPKFMLIDLIQERKATASTTENEIMQQWSKLNTVRGPVLTIPYLERKYDAVEKAFVEEIKNCYFLPKDLRINGEIVPQERYRSIYKVIVFESDIAVSGSFEIPNLELLQLHQQDLLWDKSEISFMLDDLRGIRELAKLTWNNKAYEFSPGIGTNEMRSSGISVQVPVSIEQNTPLNFHCVLKLKGSRSLRFSPLGETTHVQIQSTWKDPGFIGNFLPEEPNISENGFNVIWKVLHFNRNFPQQWKENQYDISGSDFGVQLITLTDHYQKNTRSAKYCILIILFTFISFFLNEVITKEKIHPFQYILVGSAVLIFYLLLLSISEHLGFDLAYLIASLSVILLVFFYSRTFLSKWSNSLLLTMILTFSFGFIYILMQLESYALLVGSFGLFIVLMLTMFFTRRINWYNE